MCNKENCEKKFLENLEFFLDGHIDECADGLVTMTRDEYAELIAEKTMLRMVERVIESDRIASYYTIDVISEILGLNTITEPPAKTPPTDFHLATTEGPDEEEASE